MRQASVDSGAEREWEERRERERDREERRERVPRQSSVDDYRDRDRDRDRERERERERGKFEDVRRMPRMARQASVDAGWGREKDREREREREREMERERERERERNRGGRPGGGIPRQASADGESKGRIARGASMDMGALIGGGAVERKYVGQSHSSQSHSAHSQMPRSQSQQQQPRVPLPRRASIEGDSPLRSSASIGSGGSGGGGAGGGGPSSPHSPKSSRASTSASASASPADDKGGGEKKKISRLSSLSSEDLNAVGAVEGDTACTVEEIQTSFFKSSKKGGLLGFAKRGLAQMKRGFFGSGGGSVLGREFGRLEKKYVMMEKELGAGQFGVTRVVQCKQTGRQLACKSINKGDLKSKADVEGVKREVMVHEMVGGHANVAKLEDVFEDDEAVHLVMELCHGGELFDRIKERRRLDERDAQGIMQQVLSVLAHCHQHGIVHRDIKPENILLKSQQSLSDCRVIDFGIAATVKPGSKPLSEFMGSPYYVAPEVVEGSYSFPADIWSAGVVFYVMLAGVPPFWARTEAGVIKAIKEAKASFRGDVWRGVSAEAVDLIKKMLTRDTKKRITALGALAHPWFGAHLR
ncbi:hypothetical protein CLOP_g17783 [Closterium sp. NIES-67]|nr:hypothetical protein CLOP_g17783 [Closterium sp. NIES-67]